MSTPNDTNPEVVLILGKTGVGKSTFIKAATGLDISTGDSLDSCTTKIQIYPVANTRYFLIDTPGFDDPALSDVEILQSIASCLSDMHEGLIFADIQVKLSGIIYVHAIDEPRMTGSMMQNLKMFRLLVGEDCMDHCVLVTSKWGLESPDVACQREAELIQTAEFWGGLLADGATIERYWDDHYSALGIIEVAVRRGVFLPQLVREYTVQGKKLDQTAAGRAIDLDLAKARDRNEQELGKLKAEHEQARETNDTQATGELMMLSQKIDESLKALDAETEQLRTTRIETQKQLDKLDDELRTIRTQSRQGRADRMGSDTASVDNEDDTKTVSETSSADDLSIYKTKVDRRRERKKRALRWFSRLTAFGGAVTMTVLTSGAMAPVGLSLYGVVEAACQADKDRETRRFRG
ncbi:MAG: hypothetical protein Q9219_004491 [cf. Caloplaca sp. 3 TL-2023]